MRIDRAWGESTRGTKRLEVTIEISIPIITVFESSSSRILSMTASCDFYIINYLQNLSTLSDRVLKRKKVLVFYYNFVFFLFFFIFIFLLFSLCNFRRSARYFRCMFWRDVLKVYSPAASTHFYSRYEKSHENVTKNKKLFENLKTLLHERGINNFINSCLSRSV